MSWPTADIPFTYTAGDQYPAGWHYRLGSSSSTFGRYELYRGDGTPVTLGNDIEFTISGSTISLDVDPATGASFPYALSVNGNYDSNNPTQRTVQAGDTITLWDSANGTSQATTFVVPSNFPTGGSSGGSSGSGPSIPSLPSGRSLSAKKIFSNFW